MGKIAYIIFIVSVLFAVCATRSTITPDQVRPDDKYMTPHERSLVALTSIKNNDMLLATREVYFTSGSEEWNRALSSYRYRTKARISLGSKP